jgi:hypothetical protein
MRNLPETITVEFAATKISPAHTKALTVEEFQPYEPSAYCWTPGWVCLDVEVEYFIDETGQVWRQPENTVVGVAPEIKADADKLEAALAEAWEQEKTHAEDFMARLHSDDGALD